MSQMELFDDRTPSVISAGAGIGELLESLKEISPNAHDDAVYALLSELPLEAEVRRFARRIAGAAEAAGSAGEAGRRAAEKARTDRLDPDTEKVQAAAWKVAREFDRMRGLLRFSAAPGGEKMYIARCAPDHFVLPLLKEHFLARFGEVSWAIIDEKRDLVLVSERGGQPVLRRAGLSAGEPRPAIPAKDSGWERLWRTYHKAVNNEVRANPGLQKQFMPQRYWKYLPEMRE